ncbi:MAG: hypothetical protein KatS3mg131_0129 [Candidatus Tectimicrobiota bacterium]|nr:MAG: hypothetical protein KatS3mg131_0129 [Candidatus Tectomicrobia bacterium]
MSRAMNGEWRATKGWDFRDKRDVGTPRLGVLVLWGLALLVSWLLALGVVKLVELGRAALR